MLKIRLSTSRTGTCEGLRRKVVKVTAATVTVYVGRRFPPMTVEKTRLWKVSLLMTGVLKVI